MLPTSSGCVLLQSSLRMMMRQILCRRGMAPAAVVDLGLETGDHLTASVQHAIGSILRGMTALVGTVLVVASRASDLGTS